MSAQKLRIDSMDIVKCIASVLIVSMHAKALDDFPVAASALELAARWGVPFFFLCSSFLLFRKCEGGKLEKQTVAQYSKRILILYLVWFVYNLPNVYVSRLHGKDLHSISTYLIFLKDTLLSSTFTGSWYLLSSIFSAWFIYLLSKKCRTGAIVAVAFLPFCLCAVTSVYAGLLPEKAADAAAFLCFPLNICNGCFYFALGKLFAENTDKIKEKISPTLAAALLAVFYVTFVAEILLCKRGGILGETDVGFSLPGIACMLLLLCLHSGVSIKNPLLLRKLSTVIFCCQGNALLARLLIGKVFHIESGLLLYAAVAVIVSVVCGIVLFLQNHTQWKWCRYLT